MDYRLRKAHFTDLDVLHALISRSAHSLSVGDYTPQQIDGALQGAFGVDSQLIRDGTYFVIECEGQVVACGGWSRRRTLFGGDTHTQRDAAELDPRIDAARIRAFFVDPQHSRRGLGKTILRHCESEAVRSGFSRFELMATLPGVRLYQACGYQGDARVEHALGAGLSLEFVPMHKTAQLAAIPG